MNIDPSFYHSTLDNLTDGVVFVDQEGRIVYWNPGMEILTGYRLNETQKSKSLDSFLNLEKMDESGSDAEITFVWALQNELKPDEILAWILSKTGERIPVIRKSVSVRTPAGAIAGTAQTFRDARFLYELQSRLQEWEKRASIDFLTELPNRSFVEMNLRSRLYEYRRNGWLFGVLMIDVDHFKAFNDTHGHDIGDAVLKRTAATLAKHARPYDVIGRWGGEEFLGIIAHVDKLGLYSLAERIRFLVQKTGLKIEGKTLRVTISIGAAIVHPDDDQDSLLKRADQNLYQSKQNGRNRTTVDYE